MSVYLDASIVLRKLQREAGSLASWGQWERAYSSELIRVDVSRAIDRNRLKGGLTDRDVTNLIDRAHAIFDGVEFVTLSRSVLNRAAQSFFTPLGTLDALHLATALRLVESIGIELTFLTHDTEFATAARSMDFKVEGA
jgi:predicted nucleic acid-binding protein